MIQGVFLATSLILVLVDPFHTYSSLDLILIFYLVRLFFEKEVPRYTPFVFILIHLSSSLFPLIIPPVFQYLAALISLFGPWDRGFSYSLTSVLLIIFLATIALLLGPWISLFCFSIVFICFEYMFFYPTLVGRYLGWACLGVSLVCSKVYFEKPYYSFFFLERLHPQLMDIYSRANIRSKTVNHWQSFKSRSGHQLAIDRVGWISDDQRRKTDVTRWPMHFASLWLKTSGLDEQVEFDGPVSAEACKRYVGQFYFTNSTRQRGFECPKSDHVSSKHLMLFKNKYTAREVNYHLSKVRAGETKSLWICSRHQVGFSSLKEKKPFKSIHINSSHGKKTFELSFPNAYCLVHWASPPSFSPLFGQSAFLQRYFAQSIWE